MTTHGDAQAARDVLDLQRKKTTALVDDILRAEGRGLLAYVVTAAIVSAIRELALDARLHYIEEQGQ